MTSSEIRVRDSTGGSGLPVGLSICHVLCVMLLLCVVFVRSCGINTLCCLGLTNVVVMGWSGNSTFSLFLNTAYVSSGMFIFTEKEFGGSIFYASGSLSFLLYCAFRRKKICSEYRACIKVTNLCDNLQQESNYFQFWIKQVLCYAYPTYFLINKKKITKKRICCGKSNQKLHEFIKQPGQTWPKLPGFF